MPDLFLSEPKRQYSESKIGILLLNLGSPFAPTTKAVRTYLAEFLSDKRVIELPTYKWQPILKGIILPFRSPKSAKKYQRIWLKEGSPLLVYTAQQTNELQKILENEAIVDFAMTYGQPSLESAVQKLKERGVTRLIVLPLYPQYAGSSTAASLDALYRVLMKQRNMLDVTTIRHFFDHPSYIKILAQNIQNYWRTHQRSEHLLMSFHGVPVATIERGDPYFDECHQTAKLVARELGLGLKDYTVCFQSRFGNDQWVSPSTQKILAELPPKGVKSIDIVCPGFVSDCLETLEEISIDGKEIFETSGGEHYQYIPCPNAAPEWIMALKEIISPFLPSAEEIKGGFKATSR